jgi:putative transposase
MKAKQYTEEQIIAVLREAEAGAKVADLCRKYGMSDATYYTGRQSTPVSPSASSNA